MSAIGNYIHLTAKGYVEHGTSLNSTYRQWSNQAQWRQAQIQKIPQVLDKTIEEYEDMVNALSTSSNQASVDTAKIQNSVLQKLIQEFPNKFTQANFDTMTIDLPRGQELQENYIGRVRANLSKNKSGETLYTLSTMRQLVNKINKLEVIFQKQSKKALSKGLTTQDLKEFESKIKQIKKLYKDAYGKVIDELDDKTIQKMSTTGGKEVRALRDELNSAIATYASYPALSLYEGTLWEYILGATAYAAGKTAYSTLEEAIQKTIQGNQNIETQFNTRAFAAGVLKNIKINNTALEIVEKEDTSVRSKIDVSLTWGQEKLNISAKNIAVHDTHGFATLVSNSPLLVMIQNMDTDFVNHYLNCRILHLHGTKYMRLDSAYSTQKQNVNQATDEMSKNLIITALTGLGVRDTNKQVNIFAVNDKNKRGIKIITVHKLAKKLENAQLSVKFGKHRITQYYFKANKEFQGQNAIQRINGLMQELHALKVHASFNTVGVLY